MSVFETSGLTAFLAGRRGNRRVLDSVDIAVQEGRTCAVLGESGSGKTFLLHSVLGLHAGQPGVVAGKARLLGVDLLDGLGDLVRVEEEPELRVWKDCDAWDRALRRRLSGVLGRSVTLVPQDPSTALPPFQTVGRLLQRAVRAGRPGLSGGETRREGLEWLERVQMYGVDEVARRYVHELSGGMAQRVALALALAPGPTVLVADEPTTGLDATLRVQVLDLLAESVASRGLTLLLITHDTEAARALAVDVVVVCEGRVVERGPTETVLNPAGEPKHPYTRYLLEAERCLLEGGGDLRTQAREPTGEGCSYRKRCPHPASRCEAGRPGWTEAGPNHRVACPPEALS